MTAVAMLAVALGGCTPTPNRAPLPTRTPAPPSAPLPTPIDNGLARTPVMGFNDWNAFGCDVSARLIEQTADAMVANGMKAAGYSYLTIDDCWMARSRNPEGHLVPDPAKFPDGIAPGGGVRARAWPETGHLRECRRVHLREVPRQSRP